VTILHCRCATNLCPLYYNKIRLSSGVAVKSPSGVTHDPLPLGIYKKQQELVTGLTAAGRSYINGIKEK